MQLLECEVPIVSQWLSVRMNDLKRLKQCVACDRNPETCGCSEADEDKDGMCQKYVRRQQDETKW